MRVVLSSVALLGVLRGLFAVGVAVLAVLVLPTAAAPAVTFEVSYSLPAWSPDGSRIAWASVPFIPGTKPQTGVQSPWHIWTANADGSDAAPLLRFSYVSQIAWPSAQEIVYATQPGVWLARPDGAHKRILRIGRFFSTDAQGTRVASTRDFGGPIVVVRTATGKRTSIRGFGKLNGDPILSPDGRHILFNKARYGLYVAWADGKGLHRITAHGFCASWSPQGDEIAFARQTPHGIRLRLVRPDGTHNRVLLKHWIGCFSAAWSPDGRQIAYVQTGRVQTRIVVVDVASGHEKKLWAFTWATGIAWSPDSKQLLVTAHLRQHGCSSLWTIDANGKSKTLIRNC